MPEPFSEGSSNSLNKSNTYTIKIKLNHSARSDILWWLNSIESHNGVSYYRSPWVSNETLHLWTDASDVAAGAVFGNEWFCPELMELICCLYYILFEHGMECKTIYLPSAANVQANAISHFNFQCFRDSHPFANKNQNLSADIRYFENLI